MKRKLFASILLALSWPTWQVAKSADVSVDFFYNNLSGGSWIEVADYGYCWQPDVVVSNASWRPYSDGYWAYTDLGWTWVSYEDFGWATYHYGRWARLADYGWIWVPGRDADLEWGPAWVSWRTSDQYVGWAPLPPETIGIVSRGAITGNIDVEFDVGPAYYNFVDVRYIGEPVLRERIIEPSQNVTYIQQTVNVTNITYKNRTVYNYGPDINVVNTRASRPIQRLTLERQENVDVATAARSGALTKVQGDKLVVGAPMRITKSARQVAPPAVKTRVAQAKIDKGWSAVGDENAKRQFKEKLRAQRSGAGAVAAQTTTGVSPAPGASPGTSPATAAAASPATAVGASPAAAAAASPSQFERGGGRHGRAGANVAASPAGSPGVAASPAGASPAEGTGAAERGRHKGRRGERFQPPPAAATSPAAAGAAGETTTAPERGRHRRGEMPAGPAQSATAPAGAATAPPESMPQAGGGRHQGRQFEQGNVGAASAESGTAARENQRGGRRGRVEEQGVQRGAGAQPGSRSEDLQGQAGRHRGQGGRVEEQGVQRGAGAQPADGSQDPQGQGVKHRPQGTYTQPGGAAAGGNAEPQQGRGEQQGEKKQKGEATPAGSPSPH